jgi:hypothetical protein
MKKIYKRVEMRVFIIENGNVLINSDVFLYDNVVQDVFV